MHSPYTTARGGLIWWSAWFGRLRGRVPTRLGFQAVDALLCLLGVGAFGQDFEIGLIVPQRGWNIASLFLHLAEFVGGLGIFRLPIQRFLVAADGGAVVALFVIPVADLDTLHRLVRVPRVELVKLAFFRARMFLVSRRRRHIDLRLFAGTFIWSRFVRARRG